MSVNASVIVAVPLDEAIVLSSLSLSPSQPAAKIAPAQAKHARTHARAQAEPLYNTRAKKKN